MANGIPSPQEYFSKVPPPPNVYFGNGKAPPPPPQSFTETLGERIKPSPFTTAISGIPGMGALPLAEMGLKALAEPQKIATAAISEIFTDEGFLEAYERGKMPSEFLPEGGVGRAEMATKMLGLTMDFVLDPILIPGVRIGKAGVKLIGRAIKNPALRALFKAKTAEEAGGIVKVIGEGEEYIKLWDNPEWVKRLDEIEFRVNKAERVANQLENFRGSPQEMEALKIELMKPRPTAPQLEAGKVKPELVDEVQRIARAQNKPIEDAVNEVIQKRGLPEGQAVALRESLRKRATEIARQESKTAQVALVCFPFFLLQNSVHKILLLL